VIFNKTGKPKRGKTMDRIRQYLADATDAEINAIASELSIDVNAIADDEAQLIADEIQKRRKTGSALSTSKRKGAKLTKESATRKKTPDLQSAIAHTSQVSAAEIGALTETLVAGIDQYTTNQADVLLSTVRNAPNEVVAKFAIAAALEVADTDGFRGIGQQLIAGIFGVSNGVETAE
jgi:hypothetical protein